MVEIPDHLLRREQFAVSLRRKKRSELIKKSRAAIIEKRVGFFHEYMGYWHKREDDFNQLVTAVFPEHNLHFSEV